MKSLFLLGVVTMIILSSCGMPSKNNTAPTAPVPTIPEVKYPTSQQDTPATKFCIENGGLVSVETGTGDMEIAYCTLTTGEKVDAWKYMSDRSSQSATKSMEGMVEVNSAIDYTTHNIQTDCYTQINGKVFDITGMFGKHKGGDEALLSLCGKDGTDGFNKMHGGQEKPNQVLKSFEIK